MAGKGKKVMAREVKTEAEKLKDKVASLRKELAATKRIAKTVLHTLHAELSDMGDELAVATKMNRATAIRQIVRGKQATAKAIAAVDNALQAEAEAEAEAVKV